jgi:hypothetical protein
MLAQDKPSAVLGKLVLNSISPGGVPEIPEVICDGVYN